MSNPKHKPEESAGRFAYDGLERLIHEKARLSTIRAGSCSGT